MSHKIESLNSMTIDSSSSYQIVAVGAGTGRLLTRGARPGRGARARVAGTCLGRARGAILARRGGQALIGDHTAGVRVWKCQW